MLFVSTRGKADLVSASHAITRGLAGDGGLFVPKHFPHLSLGDLKAMEKKPYTERAVGILMHFLTDFSEDELRECVENAYAPEKFGGYPAPLVKVNANTSVLELWHGPTSAFKDMALQLLPHVLTKAIAKTKDIATKKPVFWAVLKTIKHIGPTANCNNNPNFNPSKYFFIYYFTLSYFIL